MTEQYPEIYLRPHEEKRIRQGHHWVYSNEVDTQRSPLKGLQAGDIAQLLGSNGKPLGVVTVNPHSLICGRLMARDATQLIDQAFFKRRIKRALALRQRHYPQPFYRLVYGDSDGLSGLVIDRFGDVLVAQTNTVAMEQRQDIIVAALLDLLKPSAIVFKNDSQARKLEQLPETVSVAYGEAPEQVELLENDVTFIAPLLEGQKTGWFYDHRDNRQYLQQLAKGKRVLDLFSYVGGWGLQAAHAGASEVYCVDASELALDYAEANAQRQGCLDRSVFVQGDAFAAAEQLAEAGERFDIVVADPPAFIKRKKDIGSGKQAYKRINQLAMRLLNPEGVLVAASCSMHMHRQDMIEVVRGGARHIDRFARVIHQGGQAVDHPVHPAIPETEYLKAIFCDISRDNI
jgi:23S rRNA (cytosine1962-C5)-methyltransferase